MVSISLWYDLSRWNWQKKLSGSFGYCRHEWVNPTQSMWESFQWLWVKGVVFLEYSSFLHYLQLSRFSLNMAEKVTKIYTRDMPWPSGYDAWLPSMSLQVRVSAGSPSGLAWSLYKCAALWKTAYGPSATERPLGTILDFFPVTGFYLVAIWPKLLKAR